MKTIKSSLFLLVLALAAVCCKPETTKTKEGLRILQRANVRMEIQKKDKQTKSDVGVVGDSASVKRLARWGYSIFTTTTERFRDPSFVGRVVERRLDADNYAFGRDTIACIYIFDFTSVFDYTTYAGNPGEPHIGVPGTERPGWLLFSETPVFIGYYDTVEQRYKDPMLESYLDTATGWWVYPEDKFLANARIDTMGYIPQGMMEANYPRLQQLYDEGRYSEMEEIMQTGYTIYTCTGEEYRELVRLGIN